jgi:hypothetical protein
MQITASVVRRLASVEMLTLPGMSDARFLTGARRVVRFIPSRAAAPSSASLLAMATPMSRDPLVTHATLPVRVA